MAVRATASVIQCERVFATIAKYSWGLGRVAACHRAILTCACLLLVLPRFTGAAEEHSKTVQAAREATKKRPAEARGGGRGGAKAGRGRSFREREPW